MPSLRNTSLHLRLLLASSIGFGAFLGLTGLVLDAAFRESALAAVQDRLQGQVYALLAAAELEPGGALRIPAGLPEARLARPGSGLYAAVSGADYQWRSDSALGASLPWDDSLPPGRTRFAGPLDSDAGPVFRFSQGVAWEGADGQVARFTFNVAEDTGAFHAQVDRFRRTLWFWLGGAALVLLGLQWVLMRWSLRPLRTVTRELRAVEAGDQAELSGDYPDELQAFGDHLNGFIRSEREHLQRYRNTLSDLAHSLKTPLAVLRSGLEGDGPDHDALTGLRRQVDRMDELVAYRLKRAARAGGRTLGVRTPVAPIAAGIVDALAKVHRDRDIHARIEAAEDVVFPGEEGDLYELLGNLLDNAFKWARRRIRLDAANQAGGHRPGLTLVVEDDGEGVDPERLEQLLERGVRGDERVAGHGLGLAVVQDIVQAYGGTLEAGRSELGGARFRVSLPAR